MATTEHEIDSYLLFRANQLTDMLATLRQEKPLYMVGR
jgi:hypothetical protein